MPTKKKTGQAAGSAAGTNPLRSMPSVDELLGSPLLVALASRVGRALVVEFTRSAVAAHRTRLAAQNKIGAALDTASHKDRIIAAVTSEIDALFQPSLRPVINATGVVLHTNLGRAPIADEAFDQMRAAATQYSNLEFDLESGARGRRDTHTAQVLARLSGAESAVVVNNNAAAVFLVLAALARGGEVMVSRGELIEIGDGFRIPDIMAESGAILREVGTTNRTSVTDYARAINDRTRLLLRVHRSNFSVTGFTAQPSLEELAALGKHASLPVYEDLGSGCVTDLSASGIGEPVVRESFAAGVSVVSFSGDKLLGGPQAGIIAGSSELVSRIRRHPMFRALRVDKLTIAALEATLRAYLRGESPEGAATIPTFRMIRMTSAEIGRRAEHFLKILAEMLPKEAAQFELRDAFSVIGGGSTPGQQLPTLVIAVASSRWPAAKLEDRLRGGPRGIPVIARVEDGRLLLDLRTVFPGQEKVLAETLAAALAP